MGIKYLAIPIISTQQLNYLSPTFRVVFLNECDREEQTECRMQHERESRMKYDVGIEERAFIFLLSRMLSNHENNKQYELALSSNVRLPHIPMHGSHCTEPVCGKTKTIDRDCLFRFELSKWISLASLEVYSEHWSYRLKYSFGGHRAIVVGGWWYCGFHNFSDFRNIKLHTDRTGLYPSNICSLLFEIKIKLKASSS
jgi:hypothetical protein